MASTAGAVLLNDAVEKRGKPSAIPTEIGGTGLKQYGGVIYEETLPDLRGARGVATFAEMRNDPVVGGTTLAIDNFVRRVTWEFDPPDEEKGKIPGGRKAGAKWADFMQTVIDDMSSSWADTVSEIFTMLPFGWSYHEVVPKRRRGPQNPAPGGIPSSDYDDGLIGWADLPIRSQESLIRWEMDDNDRARGMHQQLARGPRYVPLERAILFRTSSAKGNPEGRSVYRSAHRPWYFKRRLEEYEATGIERDAAGLPVGYLPGKYLSSQADDEQRAVAARCLRVVTTIRRNEQEGLLWPSDVDPTTKTPLFDLKLLSSAGSRQLSITDAINRKNTEIAMTVLADWILLGHQQVGTQALGSSKIDLFVAALETWTQSVAARLNATAIPQLMVLNGLDARLAPKIRPTKVTQVDAATFATTIGAAINSGQLTWSDADEDHARTVYDLPARDEELSAAQDQQEQVQQEQTPGGPQQGDAGTGDGGDQALGDLPTGQAPTTKQRRRRWR